MTVAQIEELIQLRESLEREFKSDRIQLSDRDIYEEIVAMANTIGGVLLIGVEDDGRITGAHPRHGATTDPLRLQAAISNNTIPNIHTRVVVVDHPAGQVIAIEVDPWSDICATTVGKSLRRTMQSDATPQTVPFYPYEQRSQRVDLGLIDFSAQLMEGTTFDDLNPLEFERLRQTIVRLSGDQSLLELSNEQFVKALRLVETVKGRLVPNIAGLLLLGREEVIRAMIPTHKTFFQVLDAVDNVKMNDDFRLPLVHTIEEVMRRFAAYNQEREVMVGPYRVPLPDYSEFGVREAIHNALLHRDYTRLDFVYIQRHQDHLLITSPGGFPRGISPENILAHGPKPKNPLLAESFKRIGLIEHSGRGVRKIFMGQLRYGRPAPDYSRSDDTGVRVVLRGTGSLRFTAMLFNIEAKGLLNLEEVYVLNALAAERRLTIETVRGLTQQEPAGARAMLEQMIERGLIEAKGEGKSRVYHLSAQLYRELGESAGYVRSHGIDRLRQEGLVMEYLAAHGKIFSREVGQLLGLTREESRRLIDRMKASGKIIQQGPPRRGAYYVAGDAEV